MGLENGSTRRYFKLLFVALFIIVSFLLIMPYISAVLSAFVLAFLVLPIHRWLNKKMPRSVSALISVIIILLFFAIPLIFVAFQITGEVTRAINQDYFSQSLDMVSQNDFVKRLGFSPEEIKSNMTSFLRNFAGSLFTSLPVFLLNIFIAIFGTYYLLMDWDKITLGIKKYIPLENKDSFVKNISSMSRSITYGLLIVGIIEFIISALGFYLSGVKYFYLFSILIALLAFTLVFDTSIIWAPLGPYYLYINDTATAIGVFITGAILTTDFILRPKIMGRTAKINPFIMLIGVIGGLGLFGLFGFIIGPILLVTTLSLMDQVSRENGIR